MIELANAKLLSDSWLPVSDPRVGLSAQSSLDPRVGHAAGDRRPMGI